LNRYSNDRIINPNKAFSVFSNELDREHTFNFVAGPAKKDRKQQEQFIEFID